MSYRERERLLCPVSTQVAPTSTDVVHTASETVSNNGVWDGKWLWKSLWGPGHVVLLITKENNRPWFGSRKYWLVHIARGDNGLVNTGLLVTRIEIL